MLWRPLKVRLLIGNVLGLEKAIENDANSWHPVSYPLDDLDRIWKLLCLNQFHDCLPGSAIGLAYKDVHKVS